jgi:hypothetical protein
VSESFVQITGLLLQDANSDFDACGLEFGDALPTHEWIGIDCGDNATGDSCCDKRVGAGASASAVTAWLQGDVGSSTPRRDASFGCLFQSGNLGMIALIIDMGAFSEDFVIANEDTADLRIWRGKRCCVGREPESMLHEDFVLRVLRHYVENSWFWNRPSELRKAPDSVRGFSFFHCVLNY